MRRTNMLGRMTGIALLALATATTAGAAVTTVRWGPIELPAATANGPGQVENEVAGVSGFSQWLVGLFQSTADYPVTKPCSDCYITRIEPNLVLPDGTTGNFNNGLMLHHVVLLNYSRPDILCPPGFGDLINQLGLAVGGNERFFAAGNERTVGIFPSGYGYRVGSGDDWGLIYHLMNMQPVARTVYFEFTFTWQSSGLTRTRPMWLDIDQCNDSEADTPAGYSDTEWTMTSDRSGYMVSIGGHVHDYGISIAFENVSRGQNILTSVAGYAAGSSFVPVGPGAGTDAEHPASYNTVSSDPLGLANYAGHISDMTVGLPNARVRKGNTLRLHTQYNRPSPSDHDMGIMVGFLKEDFCLTNFWCY